MSFVRRDPKQLITNKLLHLIVLYDLGPDYLNVVPSFSPGEWDMNEMTALGTFFSDFVEKGIMRPDEPVIRQRTGLPPLETALARGKQRDAQDGAAADQAEGQSDEAKSTYRRVLPSTLIPCSATFPRQGVGCRVKCRSGEGHTLRVLSRGIARSFASLLRDVPLVEYEILHCVQDDTAAAQDDAAASVRMALRLRSG
jgi:hypothetical protein